MKYAIAANVFALLSICFLEYGQQFASQLSTQIGAGGLVAVFLSLTATAITD
ncbi:MULTISPECIES: hypothetical protein [Pseudomonas syringae group]|uniref:hypothetical protein n=1 Tax=Pseudomonas syringae group TaxID=136849 RepID=UPI000F411889|nr:MULTISPECIES: hypothetical protein [Pseudomonas syringae group]MBI6846170.1 hypothetical protein [Pseudomonas syringae]MBX6511239.1 hypothetical protein [Pseudomonas syringae pv. tomato]QQN25656.1 hypothetical protein JHZ65_18485 [Pseudomonas syringae pv. maculicola]RMO82828.1 hypothetical protein ALQ34_103640 [Pseudomonas syringae pv. maculicola]